MFIIERGLYTYILNREWQHLEHRSEGFKINSGTYIFTFFLNQLLTLFFYLYKLAVHQWGKNLLHTVSDIYINHFLRLPDLYQMQRVPHATSGLKELLELNTLTFCVFHSELSMEFFVSGSQDLIYGPIWRISQR